MSEKERERMEGEKKVRCLDMRQEKFTGVEEEKLNTTGVPVHTDEDESETLYDDKRTGHLDRLGMKIDDGLHTIFTKYDIRSLTHFVEIFFFSF